MHAFLGRRQSYYSCTHKLLFTHYSWDPQLLYSEKNIKNGSHSTIHTFKNYFVTVFSIFNKINCIQTNPNTNNRT